MNFRDSLTAIADRHRASVDIHKLLAPMSSREIANQYGVSMRTAQRWRKGTQTPSLANQERIREDDFGVAAEVFDQAHGAIVGRVAVYSRSSNKRDGYRNIGNVYGDFDPVAEALRSGDLREAERAMDRVTMNAYGGKGKVGRRRSEVSDSLGIADFPEGIELF